MSSTRKRAAAGLSLALAASALLALPASANPAGTGLVISEVYGGGGNANATWTNDFIELHNPTDAAIEVDGMSVQYRSSGGTTAAVTSLSGTIPAGSHYLVQQAPGTTVTDKPLPTPDAIGTLAMSGASGQVLLVNGTSPSLVGTGNLAGNAALIDMVGYGTAGSFEVSPTGVTLTSTLAASRSAVGTDTDNNADDFVEQVPDPQNCDCAVPPDEIDATIAEIQGEGAVSPLVGDLATTQGVVTATYPTGGLSGFYLQTSGTGGENDATPGASDGLFVFGSAAAAAVQIGDFVQVVGLVSEFSGTTEITAEDASAVTQLGAAPAPVTALATAYPTSEAGREAHEGELLAPTDTFTVTNTFATNQYAEIGLATGSTPLIQPTDVADAQDAPAVAAVVADNIARAVTLDDGAGINFLSGTNRDIALPWLSSSNPIRVGARATLAAPVILEFRNNVWKFQPTAQVTGSGASVASFTNTRVENASPQEVGGDLRLATFNVLNYFNTTGEAFVAAGGSCTYFTDRAGDPVTNSSCTPDGPRGAAQTEDFERQQAKIVTAINGLGADIVSLEEIENSVKLIGETDRDDAISALVAALNTEAGAGTWAFVPSPAAADLPALADQDVIRNGFIYQPASVELVGASKVLTGNADFANAREPLAQAFKVAGTTDAKAFAVIVNHFKSKGDSNPPATGDNASGLQGAFNGDRTRQAAALSTFAATFAADRGTDAVFLTGDFNSYTAEDPLQVLQDDGFTNLKSDTEGESTYSFSGLSGSLDHVLANPAALELVAGVDIWNINSPESIAFQYSRLNYNLTQFFDATDPFAASDHDPEIVGINASQIGVEQIQILGTNDFHGRLLNNPTNAEAGAAVLAGAVKQLRAANPQTVFAAAGDLIGASTFESFIANDKPTIDALNEAGLEVSAVGNHEFDQGYDDLINRVMAAYDAVDNPDGGAEWKYLGANVKIKATGDPAVPASWLKDFGDVEVGFVGAVTEDLPSLVSPDGIADIEVTDIVEAANTTADDLRAEGADVVVLLVHEGAANTSIDAATDPASSFGAIVNGVDADIDAIVSGHTHLAYNHAVPVQAWIDEGRAVTTRPVVSSGQYGSNLNQLLFSMDSDTGKVLGLQQSILALKTGQSANFPADSATAAIVADAVTEAEVLGAVPLGEIGGPFSRAKLADGTTENRGGESTLGNLVAEVQRWATESVTSGSAQIAFMNPGGLRSDMVGNNAGGYPAQLTYKQAALVQPFANTLVNMQLTGANLKTVLEQQWQRDANNNVPSRPFLRLGMSEGFTYTYDPARPEGSRITGMWLNGVAIQPDTSYSVTVNSFLASGGDNFRAFQTGTAKQDTGKTDLEAMVDYLAANSPVPVDYTQRSVGVSPPAAAPGEYSPGDVVEFALSSLAFSAPLDVKDTQVSVSFDGEVLGTFDVNNTIGTEPRDEYGTSSVTVTLPTNTPAGAGQLTVTGLQTGTVTSVPITVVDNRVASTVTATVTPKNLTVKKSTATISVTVAADGVTPEGAVELYVGGRLITSADLVAGSASFAVGPYSSTGVRQFEVRYAGSGTVLAGSDTGSFRVVKATPRMTVTTSPQVIRKDRTQPVLNVSLSAFGFVPGGKVQVSVNGRTFSRTLSDGTAKITLPAYKTVGTKTVVVRYLGNDLAEAVRTTETFRVVR